MTPEKPVVIFGAGELAELAEFYFRTDSTRTVAGFVVDACARQQDTFCELPIVDLELVTETFPASTHDAFVAVGYSGLNELRMRKCTELMALGYELASYVSSKATVFDDLTHGWNAFILEDNTIQPFVRIGNGVTLWSGNHLGHHAKIGNFAFISSHVVVSGGVTIGARSFVGVNATTNDHINIGEKCVIGSGCLVTRDLQDESVVAVEAAKLSRVPSSRLKGF